MVIFLSRNYARLEKEKIVYNYDLFNKPHYYLDSKHFRIQKKIDLMIQDYLDCKNKIEDCEKTKDEKVLNVFLNRYMISKVK